MKRHGLWQFHRALRHSKTPWRWWLDDELHRARESARRVTSGWRGEPWSIATIIIRCANRYARRFGGIRTAADWNALCERIMARAGTWHRATERAALLDGYRARSPLYHGNFWDEFSRPAPRHCATSIGQRLMKIKAMQQKRADEQERWLRTHCVICGQPSTQVLRFGDSDLKLTGLDAVYQPVRAYGSCFAHRMTFAKLFKAARELDERRISINRTRKAIRESTAHVS